MQFYASAHVSPIPVRVNTEYLIQLQKKKHFITESETVTWQKPIHTSQSSGLRVRIATQCNRGWRLVRKCIYEAPLAVCVRLLAADII